MRRMGRTFSYLCVVAVLTPSIFADDRGSDDHGKSVAADAPATYLLHPDDQITVHSLQVKEIAEKTFRLDQNGEINFPLAGVVNVGRHSVREAENILADSLKAFYIKPDIEINITAVHSEVVSILGAVGSPSVHELKGQTRLLEALSVAGGVRGDAGPTVLVTRQGPYGLIPHRDARQLLSGESVVEIDLNRLMQATDASDNFLIEPHDVISVQPAQMVYVVGNVKKSGGFVLGGRPNLTVLQAVALAEGLDPRAAPDRARILRRRTGGDEQTIVDIKKILNGKAEDIILRPNDILFIPSSAMKIITSRTIETAIQIGAGLAIFRP